MTTACRLALIASCSQDPNSIFTDTREDLNQRITILLNDGLEVRELEKCPSFKELAQRIDGLSDFYMQMWRGHGSKDSFCFSQELNGVATLTADETMQALLKKICSKIKKDGILITESCFNGLGKNNFSEYLTGLCNAGVVVIGSKTDRSRIQIAPGLPRYQRFYDQHGKDATRIYFKTELGKVQNISSEEFNILWGFLRSSPEAVDLCYRLLGERNDPEVYAKIRAENQELLARFLGDHQAFKERMKTERVTRVDVGSLWQEMFKSVEGCSRFSSISTMREEPVPFKLRHVDLDIDENNTLTWVNKKQLSDEEKAYFFLLGVAALQKYKSVFQLHDNRDERSNRFLSEAIYAFSGLSLHAKDSLTPFQRMQIAIQTVKSSYELAKNKNIIDKWFNIFVHDICVDAIINKLNAFYEAELCAEAAQMAKTAAQCEDERLWALKNVVDDLIKKGDFEPAIEVTNIIPNMKIRVNALDKIAMALVRNKKFEKVLQVATIIVQLQGVTEWERSQVLERIIDVLIMNDIVDHPLFSEAEFELAIKIANLMPNTMNLQIIALALAFYEKFEKMLEIANLIAQLREETLIRRSDALENIIEAVIQKRGFEPAIEIANLIPIKVKQVANRERIALASGSGQ